MRELLAKRAQLEQKADAALKAAEAEKRNLTEAETTTYNEAMAELKTVNAQLKMRDDIQHGRIAVPKNFMSMVPNGVQARERDPRLPETANPLMAEKLKEALADFFRGREITATDTPLYVGSGGLSGTVPTVILNSLPSYYNLDSFALAGATVYNTEDTTPLTKPVIGGGAAPDAFSEGASSTDSHPMVVETFTFHGQKYSRQVDASEEAIMNTALDLPGEITGELVAAVATGFTSTITTAMVAALQANSACLVDSGSSDPYYSVLALIDAVPPRWAGPDNVFMGSRAMRTILRNARASTSGVPLLNPQDDTILGHRYVINDNLTRLVYGNFSAGVHIRKSPFFFQLLLEQKADEGKKGFKATQWLDQHFLAELHTIVNQPLYFTHLDVAGS